jgi:tetratricopeptide (TPR) repeat protein
MTKLLSACLLILAFATTTAAAPSLKEARLRWLKGNYEEAQSMFEELAKNPKERVPAAIGLSRALQSQGEYDKALGVVAAALKATPKDADLLARQAEMLYFRGKWPEADKAAEAALKVKPKNLPARWVQAQLYRDRGELKKADGAVRGIVRSYSEEEKDPNALLIVGLAGTENARWSHLSDQYDFVLNELYKDAQKADADFWPAAYHGGLLLLEKFQRGEAIDELDKALTINPSCAEALAAKGMAALLRFEVQEAERLAEQALKINPRLPEALRLRADAYMATGNEAGALKELSRARLVNPRDESTLGRIAACYLLQRKTKAFDAVVEEVEKFDKAPAQFYFELGERMEDKRRYLDAEKFYQKAHKLRPHLAGPLNALGLLAMRLAKEEEAGPLLDKGYKADTFNVRVSNMRRVLKHLKSYKTIKTDHFLLRYDPATDTALANYMAIYLEEVYADLAKKFAYRPKGPILIELFSTHQMFSGRVVALPDLHTIGACTGRMFAMVSPHGKGVRKPFNWARVLRHELVHIFNLEQTNFLVPHWLTEGLAVSNEGFPRPPSWNDMLKKRVPAGKLLDLETIDLGFIRPRNPEEWQLAYAQAQLYVEYLQKTYGPAVTGKLLAAYAEGLNTTAALSQACKVERSAFEKGYRAYLNEVVKPLLGKKAQEKPRTLEQLRAEYKKDPNNADVAAELAYRLLDRNRVEARKCAEQARKREKGHPKASFVLASLARRAGDVDEEKRLLEGARESKDPLVLKALGKIYYDTGEFAKAGEVFELGKQAEPYDPTWLRELARVYAQTKDKSKQIAVLKELVPTDADDFDRRARLARLLLENKDYAGAEKYAREGLEIDIRNPEVRETLFNALRAQNKNGEADRLRALLEPKGAK